MAQMLISFTGGDMVGQLFSDGRLEAEGRPLFVLQQGFMAFTQW